MADRDIPAVPGPRERVIAERRRATAAALTEYRAYTHTHPDDPVSTILADVIAGTRATLRDRRRVLRQIGWAHLEKANP